MLFMVIERFRNRDARAVYRSFRDRAPRVGSRVDTPDGEGTVRSYDVLNDSCLVELEEARVLAMKIDDCRELESSGGSRRKGGE